MSKDIKLLEEIKYLTSKGVKLNFYNCEEFHLHHKIPYDATTIEDLCIRIYIDSTLKEIKKQVDEAKKHLIRMIEDVGEDSSSFLSEQSDLYKYLYRNLNFLKKDLTILKK